MQIHSRGVNTKRHTVSYKVGNRWLPRTNVVKLARQGRIDGVSVRRGGNDGHFITSLPGTTRLYDLPTRVLETV